MLDSNLLKYNIKDLKFMVWDFETESLSLTNARPWEIAWDIYHGIEKVKSFQFYLKWKDLNVSKGAAEATGFDMRIIEEHGKNPKEVIDLFNEYLYDGKYNQLTHNGLGYDSYVHNTSMLQLGYKTDYSYIPRMYDTLPIARAYRLGKKIPENKKDFIPFQYSLLNIFTKNLKCKNSDLAKEFGCNVDENLLHGASYDISLTWPVFLNLIKKLDIQ
jgi:DNA polymerase III alpha subunit (gram-positive type)